MDNTLIGDKLYPVKFNKELKLPQQSSVADRRSNTYSFQLVATPGAVTNIGYSPLVNFSLPFDSTLKKISYGLVVADNAGLAVAVSSVRVDVEAYLGNATSTFTGAGATAKSNLLRLGGNKLFDSLDCSLFFAADSRIDVNLSIYPVAAFGALDSFDFVVNLVFE